MREIRGDARDTGRYGEVEGDRGRYRKRISQTRTNNGLDSEAWKARSSAQREDGREMMVRGERGVMRSDLGPICDDDRRFRPRWQQEM